MAESSKRPRLDSPVRNDTVDGFLGELGSFIDELPEELAFDPFSVQIGFSDLSQTIATHSHQPSQLVSPSAELPAKLQQQQQPPTIRHEPHRMRWHQQQIILLIHAYKCHRRKITNDVAPQPCKVIRCQNWINLLKHMGDCQLGEACTVFRCRSSSFLIKHWNNCRRIECLDCLPLCNSSDRPGAVPSVNTQTTCAATHQSFQQQQPMMVHPNLAQSSAALELPPPCQQQVVANVSEQVSSASSSAFPLAAAGIGASHLDIPMSENTTLSSDMGAQQQRNPTKKQQILDIEHNLELNTPETLSGNVFAVEATNHAVDGWRQSVTPDLRKHLVHKLVQAIFPSADPNLSNGGRILNLVYAHKVESNKYEMANSREEYYHLLAEKIYQIQKYFEKKRLRKLVDSTSAFTLEAPNHAVDDWRQSVTKDLRHHLLHKLIQAICPIHHPTSLLDRQIMSLVPYARKVEGDIYEMAKSREDYYHLLAEKIYKIQKDLEEKRKLRKQQGNDVVVQKIAILRKELHALQPQSGYCCIQVSREDVFEESYHCIMKMNPEDLRKRLMVKFRGEEEDVDHGGVAREWLYLLSHELVNLYLGLFQYSRDGICTLEINPNSGTNPEHLSYFHFVGRIIGIAIFHGHYLDGGFTMPFYKQLLGKPITLDDLKSVDPDLHRSLVWILDKVITEIIDHSFYVDHEAYGERIVHDLKPGGRDIPVTEENKKEYVELYVNWRFLRGIEAQFLALQKGFSEIIPQHLLLPFDERELELVISGLGKIDVEDWKKNTHLEQCTSDSDIVKWFWRAVEEFDEEQRARLLQFVTGNSRVPLQGFKALQGSTQSQETGLFTIHQVDTSTDNLPKAHTCFNRIDIPPYESYEEFLGKLTCAVEEPRPAERPHVF